MKLKHRVANVERKKRSKTSILLPDLAEIYKILEEEVESVFQTYVNLVGKKRICIDAYVLKQRNLRSINIVREFLEKGVVNDTGLPIPICVAKVSDYGNICYHRLSKFPKKYVKKSVFLEYFLSLFENSVGLIETTFHDFLYLDNYLEQLLIKHRVDGEKVIKVMKEVNELESGRLRMYSKLVFTMGGVRIIPICSLSCTSIVNKVFSNNDLALTILKPSNYISIYDLSKVSMGKTDDLTICRRVREDIAEALIPILKYILINDFKEYTGLAKRILTILLKLKQEGNTE